jgi:hypothetical protein
MKNTLAENMLRFGVKNLSEDVKTKLAEQGQNALDLANLNLPNKLQPMISNNTVVSQKETGKPGEEKLNVTWSPKSIIVPVSDDKNTVLILGTRTAKDKPAGPFIAVTLRTNGQEINLVPAKTIDLIGFLKLQTSKTITSEPDMYNLFNALAKTKILGNYVVINPKDEFVKFKDSQTGVMKDLANGIIRALQDNKIYSSSMF